MMPHDKSIPAIPLAIANLNLQIMSFLNAPDLYSLAKVNRTFRSLVGQHLTDTQADNQGNIDIQAWLAKFLRFKSTTKDPHPLGIAVLNNTQIPSKLRLNFIDHFLNIQNMSTAQSLDFLLFACNIAELFHIAVPIFFRKLSSMGNYKECDFIFQHLMQLLDSETIAHKCSAILTIADIIDDLNAEQQNLACDKFAICIKVHLQGEMLTENELLLTKIILKVIPKILAHMEFVQHTIRTIIHLFATCPPNMKIATLTAMLDIFDNMEAQQQINCVDNVLDSLQTDFTNPRFIKEFWLPSIFDKMNQRLRKQTFEKIVRHYHDSTSPIRLACKTIIPLIFDKISLEQQLAFFDQLISPDAQYSSSDLTIFTAVTPVVIGKLNLAKKSQVFNTLLRALAEDRYKIYDHLTIITSEVLDTLDSTQQVKLLEKILDFIQYNHCANIFARDSRTTKAIVDIFDRLEDSQQIIVFNKLINIFHYGSNLLVSIYAKMNSLYAIEAILNGIRVKHEPERLNKFSIKIIALLDGNNEHVKEAAIRLLPIFFSELSAENQIQVVNKILALYASDNNDPIKLQITSLIAEIFARLGQQQAAVFDALLKLGCRTATIDMYPLQTKIAMAIAKIFHCLNSTQQMQAYDALLSFCKDDDDIINSASLIDSAAYKKRSAISVIGAIIDRIQLDSVQQQMLLDVSLRICGTINAVSTVPEGLAAMPMIFSKLQDDAQRATAVAVLHSGTHHGSEYARATAINSLVEIYDQLTSTQQEFIRAAIRDLVSDSSAHVRMTTLGLIPIMYHLLEPDDQRLIFNRVMLAYSSSHLHRILTIKSAILFCHSYSDGSYCQIAEALFPRAKLSEYCEAIKIALNNNAASDVKRIKCADNNLTYSWQAMLDQPPQRFGMPDQTRVDPARNPFQLLRLRF